MMLFGYCVWGTPPEKPIRQSVQERKAEFERELVRLELDHIDMGIRKVGLQHKIEYLAKYLADLPVNTLAMTKAEQTSMVFRKDIPPKP
jgi:hypothetical protein